MNLKIDNDKFFELCLKLSISLCFSSAAYQFYTFSNSTFSWFFVEWSCSESTCKTIVLVGWLMLLVSSLCIWIPQLSQFSIIGSFVLLLDVIAYMNHASDDDANLVLISNCLKVFTPLIFLFYKYQRYGYALFLARTILALTFLGHGLRALWDYPLYLDYLTYFFELFNFQLRAGSVLMLLHVIGTIDLALAHHVCFYKLMRIKWVVIYMALWGLITALARVMFAGPGAWHEVTTRAPHFLVPLALVYLIYRERSRLLGHK